MGCPKQRKADCKSRRRRCQWHVGFGCRALGLALPTGSCRRLSRDACAKQDGCEYYQRYCRRHAAAAAARRPAIKNPTTRSSPTVKTTSTIVKKPTSRHQPTAKKALASKKKPTSQHQPTAKATAAAAAKQQPQPGASRRRNTPDHDAASAAAETNDRPERTTDSHRDPRRPTGDPRSDTPSPAVVGAAPKTTPQVPAAGVVVDVGDEFATAIDILAGIIHARVLPTVDYNRMMSRERRSFRERYKIAVWLRPANLQRFVAAVRPHAFYLSLYVPSASQAAIRRIVDADERGPQWEPFVHADDVASLGSEDGQRIGRDMVVTDRIDWLLDPARLRRLRAGDDDDDGDQRTVLLGLLTPPRGKNGPSSTSTVAAADHRQLQTATLGAGYRADQSFVLRSADNGHVYMVTAT